MQRLLLITLGVVIFSTLCAQDTIWFRNSQYESGKVIEIGPELVKFTKQGMINGPVYLNYKSEIERIRFENGEVQHFAIENYTTEKTTSVTPAFQKILLVHKTLFYDDRPLSETKLKKLINAYPDAQKRKELTAEFGMMIEKKRIQHTWSTAGPIAAGLLTLVSVGYAADSENAALIPLGFAAGGIVLLSALSKAREFKRERLVHMNRIVTLYNSP